MSELRITHLESAPAVPFKLDGRIMYSSDRLELIHLILQPGEGMDLHTQPFDVVFFVISGNGTLFLSENSAEGNPGTCIHVPAGTSRGWRNTGKTEFRVLVVKDLK
jgi:quercetin dioxygenase-like cupin family protein